MRVTFKKMQSEFERILLALSFDSPKAEAIATIFTENSCDGVYSHGLNRFPVFVEYVKDGFVKTDVAPALDMAASALEKWNGHYGPGVLNARHCMDRAMQLADRFSIGCVALKNTNHWMRGGTYGWQAANAGYIGLCFTNTTAILPPWGGIEPRLGNNPLVIAVPRADGHLVLDMAMSQYSVGKLAQYKVANQPLPLPGGYDMNGDFSKNAGKIIESKRLLPIGFWKGSGLAMMLDILTSVLSQGNSTADMSSEEVETGISQTFICIKPDSALSGRIIEQIISYTKSGKSIEPQTEVRYPGENTLKTRIANLKGGIPVDEKIWAKVLAL